MKWNNFCAREIFDSLLVAHVIRLGIDSDVPIHKLSIPYQSMTIDLILNPLDISLKGQ